MCTCTLDLIHTTYKQYNLKDKKEIIKCKKTMIVIYF